MSHDNARNVAAVVVRECELAEYLALRSTRRRLGKISPGIRASLSERLPTDAMAGNVDNPNVGA
jgi:hypothetical protein